MVALPLRQGTPEWLEGRRALITATDIPVLLGISPWSCEADLADIKLSISPGQESTIRMRIGSALEGLIRDEYEAATGTRLMRFHGMVRHPEYEWAAATPDARVVGERRLVEFKRTASRTRFADGVPQDVAAQVAWQLGCTGYPGADVAVLTDDALTIYPLDADPDLFRDLVAVAQDFRRRLAEGGPFARNDERIRRDYPTDSGTMLPATPDLIALAHELADARAAKAEADSREKTIASALRAILLDASGIEGVLTYRKSADSTRTNWPAVAGEYRALLDSGRSAAELDAVIAIHSDTKTGPRVLRLSKETNE